jgi:hypothetical protein
VIDHRDTVVLPENELTKEPRRRKERDDQYATDFDETLVLEDELAERRQRRSSKTSPR